MTTRMIDVQTKQRRRIWENIEEDQVVSVLIHRNGEQEVLGVESRG